MQRNQRFQIIQIISNKPFLPLPTAFHSQFPCRGMSQTEAHHLKIHQQTEVYKLKPLKITIKSTNPQPRKAKTLIPNQQTHHMKIKINIRPPGPSSFGSRDRCMQQSFLNKTEFTLASPIQQL